MKFCINNIDIEIQLMYLCCCFQFLFVNAKNFEIDIGKKHVNADLGFRWSFLLRMPGLYLELVKKNKYWELI